MSKIGSLVQSYIILRLFLVFGFIPMLHLFWNKKSVPDLGKKDDENYFMYCISLLQSFDAEHFKYVATNGYTHEKNHAFFPGYPVILSAGTKFMKPYVGELVGQK